MRLVIGSYGRPLRVWVVMPVWVVSVVFALVGVGSLGVGGAPPEAPFDPVCFGDAPLVKVSAGWFGVGGVE